MLKQTERGHAVGLALLPPHSMPQRSQSCTFVGVKSVDHDTQAEKAWLLTSWGWSFITPPLPHALVRLWEEAEAWHTPLSAASAAYLGKIFTLLAPRC